MDIINQNHGGGKKAVDYEKENLLLLRKLSCECGKMEKGSWGQSKKEFCIEPRDEESSKEHHILGALYAGNLVSCRPKSRANEPERLC